MLFGKHINKYYLKYGLFYLVGLIALIAVNYYQLEIPDVCGKIIDGIKDNTLLLDDGPLLDYVKYLIIITIIMFSGRFLWRYCVIGTGAKIESDLRYDLFNHSLKLSNQYYKEHKTGALMALFTNDLSTIRTCFGIGLVMVVDATFLGALSMYRMFQTNYILASFSLIPMALIAVVAVIVGRILRQKFEHRQEAYDNISDFAQENFSGISVIKAFVKEIHEIRHFKKLNDDNYDKNVDFLRYSTLLDVLLTMILELIFAIIFAGGSYFVIYGFNGKEFTPGDLFKFVAYFDTVIWPFLAVAQLINMRAQGKASYKRISELLDEKIDIVDNNTIDIDRINGKICFNHLNFKYPDGSDNTLNDISFTIESGEMVGIIGRTGCGKTTIVDLLLRTYNIGENEILIDDKDIMNIPFKKVRESIGYVPQDNFLFSDTIANNIAFAFKENDDDKIILAAKLADVDNNINDFTDKYQTILGERGVTLSGGQKQRVSIARALIKNPPILIFDDSVSAVDTKTEANILSNLRSVREGKTTIIIAHRISTVENLDKIIVMDKGRVIGFGTHKELLENNDLYKELVHLQSLEKEINGGNE